MTPNRLYNMDNFDNNMSPCLADTENPIDILLPKETKYYYTNKEKLNEYVHIKIEKEKNIIEETCDGFLKNVILTIEDLKNKLFEDIDNDNIAKFNNLYSNFKSSVDDYLDSAFDKIKSIPTNDYNSKGNNIDDDPLSIEINNLKLQKEQTEQAERIFSTIKEDYNRFNINDKKNKLSAVILEDKPNNNNDNLNKFLEDCSNNLKNQIEKYCTYNKNDYITNDFNNDKINTLSNEIKKLNLNCNNINNNININNSHFPKIFENKSNTIKLNSAFENNKTNNYFTQGKTIDNKYNYHNSSPKKVINLNENRNTIVHSKYKGYQPSESKYILKNSNNTNLINLPFISKLSKEIIINKNINSLSFNSNIFIELDNLSGFDYSNNYLALANKSGKIFIYDINNLNNVAQKLDLQKQINKIKILSYNNMCKRLLINTNEVSQFITFKPENITIRSLHYIITNSYLLEPTNNILILENNNLRLLDLTSFDEITTVDLKVNCGNIFEYQKNKFIIAGSNNLFYVNIINNKLEVADNISIDYNITSVLGFHNNNGIILLGTDTGIILFYDILNAKIIDNTYCSNSKIEDIIVVSSISYNNNANNIFIICYTNNKIIANEIEMNKNIILTDNIILNSDIKILQYDESHNKIIIIHSNSKGIYLGELSNVNYN